MHQIHYIHSMMYGVINITSPPEPLPSSYYEMDTYTIYDDKFEKAGTLARVVQNPYINKGIYFGNFYQNFILGDNLDTITVVFNVARVEGTIFFPAGVPVPFTYLYGSGKYFNKKITGYLLPYNNKVRTREFVFFIE